MMIKTRVIQRLVLIIMIWLFMVLGSSLVIASLFLIRKQEMQMTSLIYIVILSGVGLVAWGLIRWPILGPFLLLAAWPLYPSAVRLLELEDNVIVKFWILGIVVTSWFGALLKFRERIVLHIKLVDITVMAVLMTGIYAAILASDIQKILLGIHISYIPLLMYFWVRTLPFSIKTVHLWLKIFLVVSGIIAVLGLAIHFSDPARWYRLIVPAEQLSALARSGRWRMTSILWNPLYFGPLMAIAAIFSLVSLLSTHRLRYAVLFLLFSVCTWLSITRGAYILLAVGIGVVFWEVGLRQKGITPVIVTGIIVVSVFLFVFLAFNDQLEFMTNSRGQLFDKSRFQQYSMVLNSFLATPFGEGLGVGHAARHLDETSASQGIYDGAYFKILAESGFIGIIVFLLFLFTVVVCLLRSLNLRQNRQIWAIRLGMLAAFLGFSVEAIVSSVWEHYMVAGIMWILLGLTANLNSKDEVKLLLTTSQPAN